MDLEHTISPSTACSPDTDGETQLHSQLIKPLSSFPNGKKHQQQPPHTVVAYKECLKNHAATIGSHALDGCGEFMSLPTPTPKEPTSLKCAACGCHRNFHRRESINDVHVTTANKTHFIQFDHPSSPPQPANYAYAPHVLLSFNTVDQTHAVATPGTPASIRIEKPNGRKRFRTKFSQDQKEKMSLFAEKVGWKMQRCDDKIVADFCNEIGIRRRVFKVWMHNNKNTIGRKEKETTSPTTAVPVPVTTSTVTVGVMDIYNNGRLVATSESHEEDVNVDGRDNSNSSDQENDGGGGGGGADSCRGAVHFQASMNGSSPSC